MRDYPTTPVQASTPDQTLPDPAAVQQLLATLDAIPRTELPDGPARADLRNAILTGYVDNLYRPLGADYHNIAWAQGCEAWEDPRQRVSDWVAQWWLGGDDHE